MRKILFVLMVLVTSAAFGQGVRLKTNIAGFGGAHFAGVPPGYTKLNVRYEFVAMAIDSGLHIPQYNGTPSGVRAGVWVADGAIGVDTLNHRFYIYSGGAWVRVANYAEIPAAYTAGDGLLLTGNDFKVLTKRSITIDNDSVMLVNDSTASPASYFYGTNIAGRRGWYPQSGITGANIYNSDGTLTGNRTLTLDGNSFIIPDFTNFPDTTNWKPVVINTTGSGATAGTMRKATYWPGGGGGSVNVTDSLSWIDVHDYGATDDGKEVSDAAITSGTDVLTSATASFTSADVGKSIRVGGAGASGAELLTTIDGYTNSTTVSLATNASTTVSNQRILWGTDNTAPIQNAINAAVSGNSATATVYIKKTNTGIYLLADSNQSTTSQLYIPTAAYSPSITHQKSLRLLGSSPSTFFIDYADGQKSPNTGVILQSMRNDSAYSILGSETSSSAYGYHNWTMLYLENLTFRVLSRNGTTDIEPLQSGLDLRYPNMVDLRKIIVNTESDNYNSVRPDTSTFGIRLPHNNNGGYVWLENVMVERFNSGIVASENVNGDNIWINACYNGWEFVTGTHPSYIKKSLVEWCVNGIMVSGANPNFNFGLYVIETYPTDIATKWFNTVYDFYVNTGSPGSGNLNYYRVKGGTGVEMNGLTRNDAATSSNYVFTKFNDSNPIEILRDSTNQFRVVSANNPSVLAKINGKNRTDVLFTQNNVQAYSIGYGDSTSTTENFHAYSYTRAKYDWFINSSGNIQMGGTDGRTAPQFTLMRSTGNAYFGMGGDSSVFKGAVNIYRSNAAAPATDGDGSAIHFVNPSATGRINMTYKINGMFVGSFSSDYTGNNSFNASTSHTMYVGGTSKQLINTNGVLITGDQIMHGTSRKIYWSNSGTGADANWKTGYEAAPSGMTLNTGAAVITDVYGGATTYGFSVRKTGGNSLFELQGSDGKAYFAGSVGIGVSPTTKLHVSGRMAAAQGADVASAAGAISLGTDGNTFEITGTAAITLISNVGWINGSEIILVFTSTATLTDGTANSGTDIGMELAGNANFTASADDVVTLVLCEIGGTQRWREKSRSVN